MAIKISVQRVYNAHGDGKGKRVLVDRLWPRGVKKESLKLDLWLRELAPSNELRKWFGHDPGRWKEFQRRYRAELKRPERQGQLREVLALARKSPVTLLYAARDEEHNEAIALRAYLEDVAGT